jgi:diguanylate cyclase
MPRPSRRWLVPLVLCASLGLTALSWQHEQRSAMQKQQAALDFALRTNASRIEQGMAGYQQMLRGAQGLFAASTNVAPQEFRAYVETLKLGANFSGIEGIGLLPLVPKAAKEAHVAAMRKRGFDTYAIHPDGVRPLYAPLVQVEPSSRHTLSLQGYDAYAEEEWRQAMEHARDTDAPIITGKISAMPQAGAPAGFVMFIPLYKKGLRHDTLATRRANIIGWISASFRIEQLMAGLYGERASDTGIRLYDGTDLSPQSLLYTSPGQADVEAEAERLEYIEISGRTWALAVNAAPQAAIDSDRPELMALAGISLSLLLTLLTWILVTGRERAVVLATEMTAALRNSEARYRHLAQHDVLTGLPNLALFSDRLQQALIQAKRDHARLAVLFIDLDKFKPINDALGHHMGDSLLQAVATRLQGCVREADTVARIGGDEFALLLPLIHAPQEALRVAELLRDALDQPFSIDAGHELNISSSIGVAIYPEHGSNGTELLKNADQAMYRVKREGRNQVQLYQAEDGNSVAMAAADEPA